MGYPPPNQHGNPYSPLKPSRTLKVKNPLTPPRAGLGLGLGCRVQGLGSVKHSNPFNLQPDNESVCWPLASHLLSFQVYSVGNLMWAQGMEF